MLNLRLLRQILRSNLLRCLIRLVGHIPLATLIDLSNFLLPLRPNRLLLLLGRREKPLVIFLLVFNCIFCALKSAWGAGIADTVVR